MTANVTPRNFAGEAPASRQQITSKSADPSDLAGEYPPLGGIHHQQSQDHEMAHIYNDLPLLVSLSIQFAGEPLNGCSWRILQRVRPFCAAKCADLPDPWREGLG